MFLLGEPALADASVGWPVCFLRKGCCGYSFYDECLFKVIKVRLVVEIIFYKVGSLVSKISISGVSP